MSSTLNAYTMFQQPWWLDATAPGRWDQVEIEEDGRVVARWPFVVREKFGLRALIKPKLTQSLGPWTAEVPGEKSASALGRQNELYLRLIDGLPRHDLLWQNFAPQVTNWLPFYWRRFRQSTRYTYTLDLSVGLEDLHAAMTKSRRKDIRRAERQLSVDAGGDIADLMRLVRLTFARQGLAVPYSQEYLERLDEAVQANASRSILIARDVKTGRPHASVYTISDANRTYALVGGQDPDLRNSNAGSLLKWASIQEAQARSAIFDFEGSMIQPVESFNRSFGAVQTPYFNVERAAGGGSFATSAWGLANGARLAARHMNAVITKQVNNRLAGQSR